MGINTSPIISAIFIGFGMLAAALGLQLFFPALQDKVVFLDVGQGDAIFIQNGTQQVLIDGGEGTAVLDQLAREMPFWDETIELLIESHPQQDHMEGFLHILESYNVGAVLLPRAASPTQLQEAWLQMLEDQGVPYRFTWTGQQIALANSTIHMLGPLDTTMTRAAARSDINNASTIVRLDMYDLQFLFTGDAELREEQELVRVYHGSDLLDVDVLKAGHHGSNSSTHMPLLRAATPEISVISVGAGNRFGHPHPATLQRLRDTHLFRTDESGSVRFLYTDGSWFVQ